MAWVRRSILLVSLAVYMSFPAPSLAQTYGSGEIEYGGVRLQFSGQVTTAGTCQKLAANVIQCQVPQGTSTSVQLTATRTPTGAVTIRADAIPAGWPAFQVASGWGMVNKQYSFTVPAGSAGKRFELRFRAWTAGVIGEVELKVIIDAIGPVTPTPSPPPPTYPPTEPVPVPPKTPQIVVVPERLDFGERPTGSTARDMLRIMNDGTAPLDVLSIEVSGEVLYRNFGIGTLLRLPHRLTPGESLFLTIWFAPSVAGRSYNEAINIFSNDPKRSMVTIPLSGSTPAPVMLTGPAEGEKVPQKVETEKCPECSLGILTQNCQLIPPITAKLWLFTLTIHGGSPFAAQRATEISKLVAGEWVVKYKIICLQEVFSYAGKDFAYKNAVAREWLGEDKIDAGKEGWHKLEKDGKHQDQEMEVDGVKISLLARNPSDGHAIQQIGVLKKGNRYFVTGPDSTTSGRFSIDGGLVILSEYPVIAASGFTFSDQKDWSEEEFSNKGVLYARIKLPGEPECYIHVFNTHLASGNAQKYRKKQLEELWEFIKRCTDDPQNKDEPDGHPIIVCGDFNVIGGSSEHGVLRNTLRMADAWRDTRGVAEDYTSATWVGKAKLEEGTPWGEENVLATEQGGYVRLDYILYQIFQPMDKQPPLRLNLESVTREPAEKRAQKYPWGGYTISDHLGAAAQFKLTAAQAGK